VLCRVVISGRIIDNSLSSAIFDALEVPSLVMISSSHVSYAVVNVCPKLASNVVKALLTAVMLAVLVDILVVLVAIFAVFVAILVVLVAIFAVFVAILVVLVAIFAVFVAILVVLVVIAVFNGVKSDSRAILVAVVVPSLVIRSYNHVRIVVVNKATAEAAIK
jgi:hypothetical protein